MECLRKRSGGVLDEIHWEYDGLAHFNFSIREERLR